MTFCWWTKVHQFCSYNKGGVVVDKVLFRFSIRRSVPQVFALKVESCQKSRRILDVFCPPKFCCTPSIIYTHVITIAWLHVAWYSFVRWSKTHTSYFLDSGPKFTRLSSPNAGEIVLNHMSFRFWICLLTPEIFVIKFGSCVKSRQILHAFGSNFLGGEPTNFRTGFKNENLKSALLTTTPPLLGEKSW